MISVIIPTFGDFDLWDPLAQRAQASVERQEGDCEVIRHHADTLQAARNGGAGRAQGERLCFLDADDELDPHFIDQMERAIAEHGPVTNGVHVEHHLFQPATVAIVDGVQQGEPNIIPRRPLLEANFMIIGTVVERAMFTKAGGFRDLPVLEDWDLWIRCWLDGCEPVPVPDAVYRIHVRPESRNLPGNQHITVYNQIRRTYLGRERATREG